MEEDSVLDSIFSVLQQFQSEIESIEKGSIHQFSIFKIDSIIFQNNLEEV